MTLATVAYKAGQDRPVVLKGHVRNEIISCQRWKMVHRNISQIIRHSDCPQSQNNSIYFISVLDIVVGSRQGFFQTPSRVEEGCVVDVDMGSRAECAHDYTERRIKRQLHTITMTPLSSVRTWRIYMSHSVYIAIGILC